MIDSFEFRRELARVRSLIKKRLSYEWHDKESNMREYATSTVFRPSGRVKPHLSETETSPGIYPHRRRK